MIRKFENYKNGEMCIVYLKQSGDVRRKDIKHSAWNEEEKAEKQVEVLDDYGYKNSYWEWEYVGEDIIDGHYYV